MAKKKKKKEEFDASLMGNYLPGVAPVITSSPVDPLNQITQRMPNFLQYRWRYGSGDYDPPGKPLPEPTNNWQMAGAAWFVYAFGAGPTQVVAQTPQAYLGYRMGVYPTFRMALGIELGLATLIAATFYTIIDPDRLWRAPYRGTVQPPVDWAKLEADRQAEVPFGIYAAPYI